MRGYSLIFAVHQLHKIVSVHIFKEVNFHDLMYGTFLRQYTRARKSSKSLGFLKTVLFFGVRKCEFASFLECAKGLRFVLT